MATHVVQSPQWGEVKTKYNTPAIRVENTQYTLHKFPGVNGFVANCPKVNPFEIDWEKLISSAKENNAFVVNFDVPNVLENTKEAKLARGLFEKYCIKSPRDTFAKGNVLMDLTKNEEGLFANMHKKHRYNVRYAKKQGVTVREGKGGGDFSVFYNLLSETADRQKYYIRPKNYYQLIWDELDPINMAHILIAEHGKSPLAAWMLFTYDDVLYYPYGGSSAENKNLQASTLLGWEAIRFGKDFGCRAFDMWGAATNVDDEKDSYHGFTTLKMRFGGKHVTYIDSYDLVLNKAFYNMYNTAQTIRWKFLKAIR